MCDYSVGKYSNSIFFLFYDTIQTFYVLIHNKMELLMWQIKAWLYCWFCSRFITLKFTILNKFTLFIFLFYQVRTNRTFTFFFKFYLKILLNTHRFFILINIPLFGFAKQNWTTSISKQNKYDYILKKKQIQFFFIDTADRRVLYHTIHYLELVVIVFLTQNIKSLDVPDTWCSIHECTNIPTKWIDWGLIQYIQSFCLHFLHMPIISKLYKWKLFHNTSFIT